VAVYIGDATTAISTVLSQRLIINHQLEMALLLARLTVRMILFWGCSPMVFILRSEWKVYCAWQLSELIVGLRSVADSQDIVILIVIEVSIVVSITNGIVFDV